MKNDRDGEENAGRILRETIRCEWRWKHCVRVVREREVV